MVTRSIANVAAIPYANGGVCRIRLHGETDEHFRFSPLAAILFQETSLFIAARLHLADRGIVARRDVSLVVAENDRSLDWCDPVVSQIHLDYRPMVRRVVRWANHVARGKEDREQIGTEAKFFEGGTVGPVPRF
ncbi:MAG: hypothetical protein ACK5G9_01950 [Akkermansiaceae bacterium]